MSTLPVPSTVIVPEDSQDLGARSISMNAIRIRARTKERALMKEVDFVAFACLVSFQFLLGLLIGNRF